MPVDVDAAGGSRCGSASPTGRGRGSGCSARGSRSTAAARGCYFGARLRAITGLGTQGYSGTREIFVPPPEALRRTADRQSRARGRRVRGGAARPAPGPVAVVGAFGFASLGRRGAGLAGRRTRVPARDRALARHDGPPVRGRASWVSCRAAAGPPRRPTYAPPITTTPSGAARSTWVAAMFQRLSLGGFQLVLARGWSPGSNTARAPRRVRRVRSGRPLARFDEADTTRLLADAGIVRNRLKKLPGDRGERPCCARARHTIGRAASGRSHPPRTLGSPRWPTRPPSARNPRRWPRS